MVLNQQPEMAVGAEIRQSCFRGAFAFEVRHDLVPALCSSAFSKSLQAPPAPAHPAPCTERQLGFVRLESARGHNERIS